MLLIAITGYGQEKDCQLSAEVGIDLHLVKPADPKIVALLMSVGVDVEGLDDTDEATPGAAEELPVWLESRPDGPPLTVDDLITFHFLLQDDERLARAVSFG